jgi:hypothetical protein
MPRACGPCTVCCTVGEVPELSKPAWQTCVHVCATGCAIHGRAPQVCQTFECGWLQGIGLNSDRPDKSSIFVSNITDDANGRFNVVMELKPHAIWLSGRSVVVDLAQRTVVPIIVVESGARPPHDVGSLTIVPDRMRGRTARMRGLYRGRLAPDVGVYSLVQEMQSWP